MKYSEIDKKKVKEICNNQRMVINRHVIRNCETCPLRRTLENGRTGFCWYRLNDIYQSQMKEWKKWQKEEVCHPTEVEAWLKETEE